MILSPTTPTRVGIERIIHPIPGRADIAYELDFIVKAANYQAPTYGSVDEYGTLVAESDTSPAGGACVTFTRTYIRELPESWGEVRELTLQHDRWIDLPHKTYGQHYEYGNFTKDAYGRLIAPQPPADEDLPDGAELILTAAVSGGYKNSGAPVWVPSTYYTAGGYWNQPKTFSLGGLRWVYRVEIDPVSRQNLNTLKYNAETNVTLTNNPSTAQVPVKTLVNYSYHVLPDGPQSADTVKTTPLASQFGLGTLIGIPRLETTVVTNSQFKPVVGCLYELNYSTYIGK